MVTLLARQLLKRFHLNICQRKMFCSNKSAETPLLEQIRKIIALRGAISVSQYMRECLTNPKYGYYTTQEHVLGSKGDFTTSPEISQMFGELIGVWCLNEWLKCSAPTPFNIIELGPGKGTLMADVLRAFSQLTDISSSVIVRLVEVSPKLSQTQHDVLCRGESFSVSSDEIHYKQGITHSGAPVYWYWRLQDVPEGFSCFIAQEFFDALPIHKFQKSNSEWREVLIDLERGDGRHHVRWVLSPHVTPASQLLIKSNECRKHLEVCSEGGVLLQEIASRIINHGGFSLIADYGHSGEKEDTLRGFRGHELWDPLCEPGAADLTADVDFSYLKSVLPPECITYGPITQSQFLHDMGIKVRLEKLSSKASVEEEKQLKSGYELLTAPDKMGERFKFFSIFPKTLKPILDAYPPAGFCPL